MKIFMNYKKRSFLRSTDHKISRDFLLLNKYSNDIEFYYPTSFLHDFCPLLLELYNTILFKLTRYTKITFRKLSIRNPKMWVGLEFNSTFNIVQSAGYLPVFSGNAGVLWEYTFFDLKEEIYIINEEKENIRNIMNTREQAIAYVLNKYNKVLINLRSDRAVEFAKSKFPDYTNSFINLPFLLPNTQSVENSVIEVKYNKLLNTHVIKFLFVGSQAKRKGLPNLIKAFQLLDERYLKMIELNVVSSFSDGIVEIPQNNSIIIHGMLPHNETLKLFKECHVYIMPSQTESYGLTYIEGLANGCIIVTRDKYPQIEFTENGKFGYMVDSTNPHSIKNTIVEILNLEYIHLQSYAMMSKRKFDECYALDVVCQKWYNAYKSLI